MKYLYVVGVPYTYDFGLRKTTEWDEVVVRARNVQEAAIVAAEKFYSGYGRNIKEGRAFRVYAVNQDPTEVKASNVGWKVIED